MPPTPPRLAVLIDAENIAPRHADALFAAIRERGTADIRRLYGDFSGTRLAGWTEAIARHGLAPCHVVPSAAGKNAADLALAIDAMDLLHTADIAGFCLVSSDSDFVRLAQRIREAGRHVLICGEAKALPALRGAGHAFLELAAEHAASPPAPKPPEPPAAMAKAASLLRRAFAQSGGAGLSLSDLGQRLRTLEADFAYRDYGHSSLAGLVRATPGFALDEAPGGGMRAHPTSNNQRPAKL